VQVRKQHHAFGRGSLTHTGVAGPDGKVNKHILAYIRKYQNQRILVINNLSSAAQTFKIHVQPEISWIDLFGTPGDYDEKKQYLTMPPYGYLWLKL
jgi:maltose alpha-D-glucosyltransferase/alpha-amylase